MFRLVVTAVFALAAGPTLAASPAQVDSAAGTYHVLGPGTLSCGAWTEVRREGGPPALADEDWVLGYVTAYNTFMQPDGRVEGNTDHDGLAGWLDNYCAAHPLADLASATAELIAVLKHAH